MSTSSAIADSSTPSANHATIRIGLIGVGKWALNGPARVARPVDFTRIGGTAASFGDASIWQTWGR